MNLNIQSLATKQFGGSGGNLFTQRGIKTIAIRHGRLVDAIIINNEKFGGPGGIQTDTLTLDEDEYINRIDIRHGEFIDRLEISTNKGNKIEGGGQGGTLSTVRGIIVAIGGRGARLVDQLRILGDYNAF